MNPTELRMFNLIDQVNRGGKVHMPIKGMFKVITISPFEVQVVNWDENQAQVEVWKKISTADICEIPITEELLQRLGGDKEFSTRDNCFDFVYGDGDEYSVSRREDGFWYFDDNFYGISLKIEYLHQLQNLFFDLTGKHLTIK